MIKIIEEITLSDSMLNDTTTFTLTEIRSHYQVDDEFISALIEYGLIVPLNANEKDRIFNWLAVQRIQTVLRLQRDLEINLPGIAFVFDLLQELEKTQNELAMMRKYLNND
jgi:chaperone modulatory protein CbpM